MCLPALPAIGLATVAATNTAAVALASAGLTYYGQTQSVRAAQAATDANAAAAASSAASQYRGVIVQQLQEEDAAAQEIDRVEREALKAESSAALAGIESGAGGGALADQMRNFRGAALSYQTAVKRNLGYSRANTAMTLDAIGLEARNRVSTYRPDYQRPSLLQFGLSTAGGFLDASRFTAPNRSVA